MKKVSEAAVIALSLFAASIGPAFSAEIPNTVALRKVSETRYNLSMNMLDQYAQQEIGIRIRRITGSVSEIFVVPGKVLGAEGKATVAVNQKLLPDDVLLLTVKNVVIFKASVKDAIAVGDGATASPSPEPSMSALPIVEESPTPEATPSQSATPIPSPTISPTPTPTPSGPAIDKVNYPNDAAIRKVSNGRYLLSMNMLDIYIGQEITIQRVRKSRGVDVTAEIAKVVLGAEGKAKVAFKGAVKKGDLFVMRNQDVVLFSYPVGADLT